MDKQIGKAPLYNTNFPDKEVIQWDVIEIRQEQELILKFLSTNSPYRQGVRLAIDAGEGHIEINSIDYGRAVQLWYDTCPTELLIKCVSSKGLLSVYNVFDRGAERGGVRSQLASCGMIINSLNGERIYHCNDSGFVSDFDKLVFSIKLAK